MPILNLLFFVIFEALDGVSDHLPVKYLDIADVGIDDQDGVQKKWSIICLLYTSPSPRDRTRSRMPSSA